MSFHGFSITNTPPRTSVSRIFSLSCNTSDGNLNVSLDKGWSEYSPEQVKEIINAMQEWLDDLVPWYCDDCGCTNQTMFYRYGNGLYGYDWVRCRNCKRKVKRTELASVNS